MYGDFKTIEEMIKKIVVISNFFDENSLEGEYEGVMTVGDEEYDVEVFDNGWCKINGIDIEIWWRDADDDADIEEIKELLGIKEEAEV